MKKILLFTILVMLMGTLSAQQVNMWTGEVNNDWFVPGNWSLGIVPEKQDIVLQNVAKGDVILGGGISYVINVLIEEGATLIITQGGGLQVGNEIINNGKLIILSDEFGKSGHLLTTKS